ncbi:UDP-glucose 4-epimerase-like [Portunus trituberculatus]|uniref:UDP-glucose 4-epimerase-like n=1 Tax=Portunus trituberculatus TaxID=210409 RepID=UPI001E1CE9C6|nr:UDP-glucose 4-epimerase-like [Portunus trituberculatus]
MEECGCKRLVFSSSSTVYGSASCFPTDEGKAEGKNLASPYGRSKYFCEEVLRDVAAADQEWQIIILRYFNPGGAHPSGLLGESIRSGAPLNLLPRLAEVGAGERDILHVFGGNWPTPDGTCIRDYMHVLDLAEGHVAAVRKVAGGGGGGGGEGGGGDGGGVSTYNLGRGEGVSVLEMIREFSRACGKSIPYHVSERRRGDVMRTTCSGKLAQKELNWNPQRTLRDICVDAWRFKVKNPDGY